MIFYSVHVRERSWINLAVRTVHFSFCPFIYIGQRIIYSKYLKTKKKGLYIHNVLVDHKWLKKSNVLNVKGYFVLYWWKKKIFMLVSVWKACIWLYDVQNVHAMWPVCFVKCFWHKICPSKEWSVIILCYMCIPLKESHTFLNATNR